MHANFYQVWEFNNNQLMKAAVVMVVKSDVLMVYPGTKHRVHRLKDGRVIE